VSAESGSDQHPIADGDGKGAWRRLCPDFLFFTGDDSAVRTSIIDPHGFHLVLDLKSVRVRQAVRAALDAEDVYIGD